MRFTIPAGRWKEAVGRCALVLPKKDMASALSCVRLRAEGGSLLLSATDGGHAVDLAVAAEVAEPGLIYVPGDQLEAQSGSLGGDVRASAEGDDLVLDDGAGPQRVRRAAVPAGAFPEPGASGEQASFVAEGAALAALVRAAAPSLGFFRMAGQGQYEGLGFDLVDGEVGLVTVGGASATFCRLGAQTDLHGAGHYVASVPEESVPVLLELCKANPGALKAAFAQGVVRFESPGFTYSAPRLAADVLAKMSWRGNPAYVPESGECEAGADAGPWLAALRRAMACLKAEKDSQAVRLAFREDALGMACRAQRGAGEASCPLADKKGSCPTIKLNGQRLADHLRALGPGPVRVLVAKNVVIARDNVRVVVAPMFDA